MTRAFQIRAILISAILICYLYFGYLKSYDWPRVKYSEVRAYAWPVLPDQGGMGGHVILENLTLKPGVINPDGTLLSPAQVKSLLAAVAREHGIMTTTLMCYEPHNAFVFYDSNKKPVAFVEICFDCLGKRIQPDGAANIIDLSALAAIFNELKLPMGKRHFE